MWASKLQHRIQLKERQTNEFKLESLCFFFLFLPFASAEHLSHVALNRKKFIRFIYVRKIAPPATDHSIQRYAKRKHILLILILYQICRYLLPICLYTYTYIYTWFAYKYNTLKYQQSNSRRHFVNRVNVVIHYSAYSVPCMHTHTHTHARQTRTRTVAKSKTKEIETENVFRVMQCI